MSLNRFVSLKPFPELIAEPLHEILDKLPSSWPTVDHIRVSKIGFQMLRAYVKKNFKLLLVFHSFCRIKVSKICQYFCIEKSVKTLWIFLVGLN